MEYNELPVNRIFKGDCIEILAALPENSVDLIFADPPYNLQLNQELYRPNMTRVAAVDDAWDQFASFQAYDEFSRCWLTACRRVLKETGTIWVIGSYHNIYRIGAIMQDLGFWFLNDIIWIKTNPMPNFRGVRFTNAHETLIWATKAKGSSYTFNHHAMKHLNDDLQMRSDWQVPLCTGPERMRLNGEKLHSTQKPEALLYRVILASSKPGDTILDPFFGSGTTGAMAKKLHRNWIGIEKEERYIQAAQERIDSLPVENTLSEETARLIFDTQDKNRHVPHFRFGSLLGNGLLKPGQPLYFRRNRSQVAHLKADGTLFFAGFEGSIHKTGSHLMGGSPCNGWVTWFYEDAGGELHPIDDLRQILLTSPDK